MRRHRLHTATELREPVLGTRVNVTVQAARPAHARDALDAAFGEFERLEDVFSVHRPASALCRWRAGQADAPAELAEVLGLAERWHAVAGGAFHPAAASAATCGPGSPLPFRVVEGRAERLGDCAAIDLNALAKGWIADRASMAALSAGALGVLTDAGGDVRHAGIGSAAIGIEDPIDRGIARPVATVRIANGAVAMSGTSWRGMHIIDPRTGAPATHVLGAAVVAGTAADADALSTALMVVTRGEADALLAQARGAGDGVLAAWCRYADGSDWSSADWPRVTAV